MKHKNMLIICEGNDDENLLRKLLQNYPIDLRFHIYKYNTNIHVFAKHLFQNYALKNGEIPIEEIDIIQILKEFRYHELLNEKFTDILLVFDYDPQDPRFNADILVKLMKVFCDSTNLGQLYINYPMVEASIDFRSLPDPEYIGKTFRLKDIKRNGYKNAVKTDSVIKSIDRIDEKNLWSILNQTYDKIVALTKGEPNDYSELLLVQNKMLETTQMIYVISTCLLFVRDYSPEMFMKYICNG